MDMKLDGDEDEDVCDDDIDSGGDDDIDSDGGWWALMEMVIAWMEMVIALMEIVIDVDGDYDNDGYGRRWR